MIDTHVHYDHRRFDGDRAALLDEIHMGVGVELAVNPPITYASNFTMRETLKDYPWIFYGLGVHPNHGEGLERTCFAELAALKDARTVAVGETGLDYCRIREPERRENQAHVFRQQIDLAKQLHLPLILHVRDAWEDALAILRSMGSSFDGVLHCFAADAETAKGYLDLGFRLGMGSAVTDPRKEATRQAAEDLPLDVMVLETDCPFLPIPAGTKGRPSSASLPAVADALAVLKGCTREEITETTAKTARALFRI